MPSPFSPSSNHPLIPSLSAGKTAPRALFFRIGCNRRKKFSKDLEGVSRGKGKVTLDRKGGLGYNKVPSDDFSDLRFKPQGLDGLDSVYLSKGY